jgi:hypothetical protein
MIFRKIAVVVGTLTVLTTTGCVANTAGNAAYTPPPLDRVLTESEHAWIDQKLALEREGILADYPGTDMPEPTFVRLVTLAEWPEVFASCLQEAGWDVQVSPDGGVGATVLQGQDLPYRLDSYACNVMYPIDPVYEQPLGNEQLEFLYDYQTGELTECLRAHGIHVDEPPSLQTFIETYLEPDSWNPYNDVDSGLVANDWNELNAECPQVPKELRGG